MRVINAYEIDKSGKHIPIDIKSIPSHELQQITIEYEKGTQKHLLFDMFGGIIQLANRYFQVSPF